MCVICEIQDLTDEEKNMFRFQSYMNLRFVSSLEEKARNLNLDKKIVYVEYNGLNAKFISLERYNKEFTNIKIANILCSSAFYFRYTSGQPCPCHVQNMIDENNHFESVFQTAVEEDFISFLRTIDLSPSECGIKFSGREKTNTTSLTANDIITTNAPISSSIRHN